MVVVLGVVGFVVVGLGGGVLFRRRLRLGLLRVRGGLLRFGVRVGC